MSVEPRRLRYLFITGVGLGIVLAGPLSYWYLDVFWTFQFPTAVLFILVLGVSVVVYSIIHDITDIIIILSVTTVTAGILVIVILSIPAIVGPPMPPGAKAVIFQGAIFQTGVIVAIVILFVIIATTLLSLLGFVVKGFEQNLKQQGSVHRSVHVLVAFLLILSVITGMTISLNYSSSVDQEQADVTVDDVHVGETHATLFLAVPNRLNDQMVVESAIVFATPKDGEQVSESVVFRTEIEPGGTATLPVTIELEQLSAGQGNVTTRITGSVYVNAFNGYDQEMTFNTVVTICEQQSC